MVQLVILIVFPVLLMPIFFKQQPVQDQELKKDIGKLLEQAGLRVQGGILLQSQL